MDKELARIIWFDAKKGFGFLKLMNDEKKELFFHFSEIHSEGTYKKVYPDEYVNVEVHFDEEKQKDVAKNITGVNGEKLMVDNESLIFKYYKRN